MHIVIASDHIGYQLKEHLKAYLNAQGHTITDVGTDSPARTDYPIYGYRAAQHIIHQQAQKGILICGTGVGISLAANKVHGIRAVVCSENYSAYMARLHNDANMVALGARVVGEAVAEQIVDAFLQTDFEGGRHQRRLDMLSSIEEGRFEHANRD